ncbi:MAG: hypothetical protein IJT54_05120 [Candidatus Methanomethylophilaceae archaeon]|nr:hypothetical protein [Candidatus Methanomethylophilaceae archaeon]
MRKTCNCEDWPCCVHGQEDMAEDWYERTYGPCDPGDYRDREVEEEE